MYIMDFQTAHCLRHEKTTAAQVTTLTLYVCDCKNLRVDWFASLAHKLQHDPTFSISHTCCLRCLSKKTTLTEDVQTV